MIKLISQTDQIEATSGEKVAGSEDLLTEILIRLPITSLSQCFRVSKHWQSFISNLTFIQRHTLIHPPLLSGLFFIPRHSTEYQKVRYISVNKRKRKFPFVSFLNSGSFKIVHSCNGLLICQSVKSAHFSVINPTTRQVKVLPTCSLMGNNNFALNLVFDPLRSPNYKIVCIKLDGLYKIAIFSSETGVWSLSEQPVFMSVKTDFGGGVYCNGRIHWMNGTYTGTYLDLSTMTVKDMPKLPRKKSHYRFKYFGKSEELLFCVIAHPNQIVYGVYQMKEKYSGWDFKYRVNVINLIPKFSIFRRRWNLYLRSEDCDVLSINGGGSGEIMKIVLSMPDDVVVLNLEKKTFVRIPYPVFRPARSADDATIRRIRYKIDSVHQYFKTLSLV